VGALHYRQSGQAIVLVALVLTVLFGFLGLAIDGGSAATSDRRHVQGSVDAACRSPQPTRYMNQHDYAQAQRAAVSQFATNERALSDTGRALESAALAVSCTFSRQRPTRL